MEYQPDYSFQLKKGLFILCTFVTWDLTSEKMQTWSGKYSEQEWAPASNIWSYYYRKVILWIFLVLSWLFKYNHIILYLHTNSNCSEDMLTYDYILEIWNTILSHFDPGFPVYFRLSHYKHGIILINSCRHFETFLLFLWEHKSFLEKMEHIRPGGSLIINAVTFITDIMWLFYIQKVFRTIALLLYSKFMPISTPFLFLVIYENTCHKIVSGV